MYLGKDILVWNHEVTYFRFGEFSSIISLNKLYICFSLSSPSRTPTILISLHLICLMDHLGSLFVLCFLHWVGYLKVSILSYNSLVLSSFWSILMLVISIASFISATEFFSSQFFSLLLFSSFFNDFYLFVKSLILFFSVFLIALSCLFCVFLWLLNFPQNSYFIFFIR